MFQVSSMTTKEPIENERFRFRYDPQSVRTFYFIIRDFLCQLTILKVLKDGHIKKRLEIRNQNLHWTRKCTFLYFETQTILISMKCIMILQGQMRNFFLIK